MGQSIGHLEDNMTESKHTSQERNKNYFQSFIATRASMGMIWIAGLVSSIFIVLIYYHHINAVIFYGPTPPYDILSQLLIFCLLYSIVTFLSIMIEPIRFLLFKYQRFSSIWQILSVLILYLLLALMTSFMILIDGNIIDFYGSPLSVPLLFGDSLFYLFCILYNIRWLRTELSKGMSEERTQKNYSARTVVTSPTSLVLIFGLTMLVPILIKGSMEAGLGLSLFVLFTVAFSRLHVEYAYAAVLKWQDKEYWEEYHPEDGIGGTSKKTKSFIRILLEVFFIIGLAYLRTEVLPVDSPLIPILKIIPRLILVYWGLRIVIWGYRKIKNRENSTE